MNDNETDEQPILTQYIHNEFRDGQINDSSLCSYWTRAKAGSSDFVIRNGLLFKRTPPNVATDKDYLLVVPKAYERQVLEMGHDSKYSGHTGVKKTLNRIQAVFYFPKMLKKIKNHVKSCKECQLTAPIKKKDRYPLEKVQPMESFPFDDISIDFLGTELPKTKTGNKYLMVLICTNSRFVHAIPMRNMKAESVAQKLVEFFCTFSVPRRIRCDNASGFRAELFTALRQKLGIEANFSSAYHYQSHGIVERANQTLLNIIRKFIHQNTESWDRTLPFLLFAIRNVPSETTKISANEIVFGRQLRGLLDIARDVWTNGDAAEKQLKMPTVQYLEKLRLDLEIARKAAKANISEAYDKSKAHYDKHSTERELQPGESVLILLPTDNRKLTTQWRGPHKVLKRLPNNNYEIQIENRRATLHINSLRKFVESSITTDDQTQTVSMIISEDDETAGDLITPDGDSEAGPESVTIGAQLTPAQRNAVNDLLSEYADVFTTDPGHTNLVEHVIEVTDEDPVFQPSYKVPDALRD